MTAQPRSLLFTPQNRRHTVNLVVIEGGAAFRERLGLVLRELRRNTVGDRGKPLTQQEAADAIGTDTDTIGRWERGQNLPTLDVLERIARAYQIPKEKWWILINPPSLPRQVSPLQELLSADGPSVVEIDPEVAAEIEAAHREAAELTRDERPPDGSRPTGALHPRDE